MPQTHCSHGKPWAVDCKECEIVSLKQFLKHFGARVDDARKKLAELGEEQCPVCGYYCLGNGGRDCIDKPAMLHLELRADHLRNLSLIDENE